MSREKYKTAPNSGTVLKQLPEMRPFPVIVLFFVFADLERYCEILSGPGILPCR
jgi:hypothetical protein